MEPWEQGSIENIYHWYNQIGTALLDTSLHADFTIELVQRLFLTDDS